MAHQFKAGSPAEMQQQLQLAQQRRLQQQQQQQQQQQAADDEREMKNDLLKLLLDCADELRMELQGHDFPQIVVVGDQSDGKSSLLRRLSGLNLPTGDNLCTKCPIQVRIRSKKQWSAIIRWKDSKEKEQKSSVESPGDFEYKLKDAQTQVVEESVDQQETAKISEKMIEVSVFGPQLPDLTIVDLPGINRSSENAEKMINRIIERFIESPNTIIVVVQKAANDVDTSKGRQLAAKYDLNGDRTVLVLTHCDLDLSTKAESIKRLLYSSDNVGGDGNYRNDGKLVFPVNCYEEGDNREQLLKTECAFFDKHDLFNSFHNCGVLKLQQKLQSIMSHLLTPIANDILLSVENRCSKLQEEVTELSGSDEDKLVKVKACLHKVSHELDEHLSGTHRRDTNHLFEECKKEWKKFDAHCKDSTLRTVGKLDSIVDKEYNEQGGAGLKGQEYVFAVMKRILEKHIFENYEKLSNELVGTNAAIVRSKTSKIVKNCLKDYPGVIKELKLAEIIDECENRTRQKVKEAVRVECNVFTNDQEFYRLIGLGMEPGESERAGAEFEQGDQTVSLGEEVKNFIEEALAVKRVFEGEWTAENISNSVQGLQRVIDTASACYEYLTRSKQTRVQFVQLGAKDRLAVQLKLYIKVSQRRLADAVPMTIMTFLMNDLVKRVVSGELTRDLTDEKLEQLVRDPDREENLKRKEEQLEEWKRKRDEIVRLQV